MSKISEEWKRQYYDIAGIVETKELDYAITSGYINEQFVDDPKLKQAIAEARSALNYIETCIGIGEEWAEGESANEN